MSNLPATPPHTRVFINLVRKRNPDLNTIEDLLKNPQVDPNVIIEETRSSPMMYAVVNENVELLNLLIKYGANEHSIARRDIDGKTILMQAVQTNRVDIVHIVLQCYANDLSLEDSESDKNTFIEYVNYVNNNESAILCAVQEKNEDMVGLLLQAGVNETSVNTFYEDQSVLMHAVNSNIDGIVDLLLQNVQNINVNAVDRANRQTALMYAVARGSSIMVNMLLDMKDINIDSINSSGQSALQIAESNNYTEIAKAILRKTQMMDDFNQIHRTAARQPYRGRAITTAMGNPLVANNIREFIGYTSTNKPDIPSEMSPEKYMKDVILGGKQKKTKIKKKQKKTKQLTNKKRKTKQYHNYKKTHTNKRK